MNKKKVIFFITNLSGGGAERVMTTIANHFASIADTLIVTITDAKPFYRLNNGIRIVQLHNNINKRNAFTRFFSKVGGFFRTLKELKKIIKREKPDSLLSFLNEANFFVVLLRLFGGIKCRLIVSERADPIQRNFFFRWFEKHFYKKADLIVCQSKQVSHFFGKTKNLIVIKNPVSKEAISTEKYNYFSKRIVCVGRLFPQKRFDLIIDAFSLINKTFCDYKLEIYGEGYLFDKLQKQIDHLNLENRVFLMGSKENVMRSIADSSLFVLCSDFEGYPNVLLEAMSSGIPVITTDFSPAGVAREIVGEENGIIVPANDVSALKSAIEKMLSSENALLDYRQNNRLIYNAYSEDKICIEWAKAILPNE